MSNTCGSFWVPDNQTHPVHKCLWLRMEASREKLRDLRDTSRTGRGNGLLKSPCEDTQGLALLAGGGGPWGWIPVSAPVLAQAGCTDGGKREGGWTLRGMECWARPPPQHLRRAAFPGATHRHHSNPSMTPLDHLPAPVPDLVNSTYRLLTGMSPIYLVQGEMKTGVESS